MEILILTCLVVGALGGMVTSAVGLAGPALPPPTSTDVPCDEVVAVRPGMKIHLPSDL